MQLIKQWSTEETAAERSENFGGLKTHALIFLPPEYHLCRVS